MRNTSSQWTVDASDDVLQMMTLQPSIPRKRPTVLQLQLEIPPKSHVDISIPFTKEYIRYTEHLPDASRGWEIPPAIIYLVDKAMAAATTDRTEPLPLGHRVDQRYRLYTSKLLTDLPTPDFSMPYNVIILTSTLLALFFGSVVNVGLRRWGVISLAPEEQ